MFCVLYTSFLMINRKETSIMYTIKDFRCMQHMQNMFIYLAGDSHLNSVETILQDSSQCLSDYPRNGIHKTLPLKQGYEYFLSKQLLLLRNLTWNLKMMVSKRNLLFQGLLVRFHVKFQGCIYKISKAAYLRNNKRCSQTPSDKLSKYMDVSKNSGTPKWMVYDGKPY